MNTLGSIREAVQLTQTSGRQDQHFNTPAYNSHLTEYNRSGREKHQYDTNKKCPALVSKLMLATASRLKLTSTIQIICCLSKNIYKKDTNNLQENNGTICIYMFFSFFCFLKSDEKLMFRRLISAAVDLNRTHSPLTLYFTPIQMLFLFLQNNSLYVIHE